MKYTPRSTKACRECKEEFLPTSRAHLYCSKQCKYAAGLARNRESYNRVGRNTFRDYRLNKLYGISNEVYLEMVARQGGRCAICGDTCATDRRLAVDHDHVTGRVRGLLCLSCNNGLGRFKDDTLRLQAAIEYLKGTF